MAREPFYIVGAGGFGRECLDALLAAGRQAWAFVDEQRSGTTVRGLPVLEPGEVSSGTFVVAIADPDVRRRLASAFEGKGMVPRSVQHPRAIVAPDTVIEVGSVLLANAYVSSSVRIGAHVQVNYNATIGHDAVIGSYATILPGANIGGAVRLAERATVGSNACVLQGRSIGEGATVGAGAVVTRDVPDGSVRKGVPAR